LFGSALSPFVLFTVVTAAAAAAIVFLLLGRMSRHRSRRPYR
jgi:hypothetical protein